MTDNVGIHALVTGRVQGVGFRWYTRKKAESLGLSGWVRNLVDGRVEAQIWGPTTAVEQMKQYLNKGPIAARVDDLACSDVAAEDNHGFSVLENAERPMQNETDG